MRGIRPGTLLSSSTVSMRGICPGTLLSSSTVSMRGIHRGTLLSSRGTMKEPSNNSIDTNRAPPTTPLSNPNPTKHNVSKNLLATKKVILLYIKGEKKYIKSPAHQKSHPLRSNSPTKEEKQQQ